MSLKQKTEILYKRDSSLSVSKASDANSRFRRVERVGAVTNVLGAVEDPVGQTSQEVSGRQITCDRPHREP